jgi:transcription antitermination factor NusG
LRPQVTSLFYSFQGVSSKGKPVPLSEADIASLQRATKIANLIAPHDYLQVGKWVSVVSGPFEGYEGILEQKKNSTKIVVAIPAIVRAFAVTVQPEEIEPVSRAGRR